MLSCYYTFEELQQMKFFELPTFIYKKILEEIKIKLGVLTRRIMEILNYAPVLQLDQYVDIFKYIIVIF